MYIYMYVLVVYNQNTAVMHTRAVKDGREEGKEGKKGERGERGEHNYSDDVTNSVVPVIDTIILVCVPVQEVCKCLPSASMHV